eukprot:gene4099-20975_t
MPPMPKDPWTIRAEASNSTRQGRPFVERVDATFRECYSEPRPLQAARPPTAADEASAATIRALRRTPRGLLDRLRA